MFKGKAVFHNLTQPTYVHTDYRGNFRKIGSLGRLPASLPEHGAEASLPEEAPALMNLSLIMTRISKPFAGCGKEGQGPMALWGVSMSSLERQKSEWT